MITTALKSKGFQNIDTSDRRDEPILVSGLKMLIQKENSNLGWRIIAGVLMPKNELEALLKQTEGTDAGPLHEMIDASYKIKAGAMIKTLKRLNGNTTINEASLALLEEIGVAPYERIKDILKNELMSDIRGGASIVRKIPIKATTIESSRGRLIMYLSHISMISTLSNTIKRWQRWWIEIFSQ